MVDPLDLATGRKPARQGANVALASFGGGLVWGSMILEWSTTGRKPANAPGALARA